MTDPIVDTNKMVPPPHLLKKFSEQARVDSQKRGHSGYCKTFARLCIDWALNSQPMTTPLSPAAQVILDAAMQHSGPAFEPVVCKMVAAALHAVAYQLAFGHATGSGIIDEDDLRSVANELKRWKQ